MREAVFNPAAIEEHHHVGAQMALVVQHIACQPGIEFERLLQRLTQDRGAADHIGHRQKTAQLRRENQPGHDHDDARQARQ